MDFSGITIPVRVNLLISFMDIQGFSKISKQVQDLEKLFNLLNGWASVIIKEIESAGGKVIKFIGDSCLSVFSEEDVDAGVHALLSAKGKAEAFLAGEGYPNKIRATGHYGEAIAGVFGAGGCRGFDVFGDSVNISATLERVDARGQLVLSPQAFRKLSASSRKAFHKYTPPIVYIAGAT